MSLCPMSWKNIRRWNSKHGTQYVHMSAHHNHDKLAVDVRGDCWWIGPDGTVTPDDEVTTTASVVRGQGEHSSPEWRQEIERRLGELRQLSHP